MRLNALSPPNGSRSARKRLGRGIGSTLGKTSGKGHKGQKARTGGYHKKGFEGGQMPLQRRLPKVGFKSRTKEFNAQICLHQLRCVAGGLIDLDTLKKSNLVNKKATKVTIIDSGEVDRVITIRGVRVTPGAKAKIEAFGGTIEV